MKNAAMCEKKLSALLKKLGSVDEPKLPSGNDAVEVLIFSFLLWESTTQSACDAYEQYLASFVDANELRVSLPYEMASKLGLSDDHALERCQRLRAALTDVFKRENAVNLERVATMGKRDLKKYLDSLEGMAPYVAARVSLLAFDAHAIPVDEQLRKLLVREGVAEEEVDVAELSAWLSRKVKAAKGRKTHAAFQSWADSEYRGSKGRKRTKRPTRKKEVAAVGSKTPSRRRAKKA